MWWDEVTREISWEELVVLVGQKVLSSGNYISFPAPNYPLVAGWKEQKNVQVYSAINPDTGVIWSLMIADSTKDFAIKEG